MGGNPVVEDPQDRIVDKLRKILEMAKRGTEHEAAVAAETLQRMLTAYNLKLADLEEKGAKRPGVTKGGYDLGKAAFKWKLKLAEGMADHYWCHALVSHEAKTVAFVGRPDNVGSLVALYEWVIEQIKVISATERRKHLEESGEHIDPLRWQVNFGLGAVSRLVDRLGERRRKDAEDNKVQALVISHRAEVSDWLEANYGYRVDGQMTKRYKEWKREQDRVTALKTTDPAEYYRLRPWDRPEEVARREKEKQEAEKREARNRARRVGRAWKWKEPSPEEERREEEAQKAKGRGRAAGDRINLEPFIGDGSRKRKGDIGE